MKYLTNKDLHERYRLSAVYESAFESWLEDTWSDDEIRFDDELEQFYEGWEKEKNE